MAPKTKKTTNAGNSPRGKTLRLTHERSVAVLKALADSRRYELLERIANARGPMSCSQVLEAIPIAPATLSHHIKELETAGKASSTSSAYVREFSSHWHPPFPHSTARAPLKVERPVSLNFTIHPESF